MVGSTTAIGLNGKGDEATFWRYAVMNTRKRKISTTIRKCVWSSAAERAPRKKQKGRGRFPDY
jgi:hypothetical protein